jgi:RNA polymerase sigma factor (TIGR02999 family)
MLRGMADVTQLLDAAAAGDPHAAADLLPLVYAELRALAAHRLAAERADHTLQPTALVHEAYLRLVGGDRPQDWNGRGHFFGAAAEAMRRILIESARQRRSKKAGGGRQRLDLNHIEPVVAGPDLDLIALDDALVKLERKDRRKADLVKLRFFAGLTVEQAARALGIAPSTADEDWAYARSWLRLEIGGHSPPRDSQESAG